MLKKLVGILLILVLSVVALATPALADAAAGAKVFSANCASCHAGGRNIVNGAKTLAKADLEKYSMNSLDAITTQIKKGKAAMPAFTGRLSEDQIADVASYVLDTAEKGWK